jgi:hypothetical protein
MIQASQDISMSRSLSAPGPFLTLHLYSSSYITI